MEISFRPISAADLQSVTDLANRGFSDYFAPIRFSPEGLLEMVRRDSVDLDASRIVCAEGEPVGAAFMARRGWSCRLAAMAIVPEARARGAGEALVRHLLAEATARGERAMTLEVIEQNTRAEHLYARCGFRAIRRLVGYAGAPAIAGAPRPEEVDLREVAGALTAHGTQDLPWQLSGETLAQTGPPSVAYRMGDAWIALSDPAQSGVTIRALVTRPEARRRGAASALLRGVIALTPHRQWRVPSIWPEELGGLFEKLGMERTPLTQWQMSIALAESPT